MGILIDSSVFIAAERGRLSLAEHIAGQEHEPVAIIALTASQLLQASIELPHLAKGPAGTICRDIRARLPVAEFGLEAARVHARVWADLLARGETVGAYDLIIGATAIAIEFQVATVNARDFQRIPGLRVQICGN